MNAHLVYVKNELHKKYKELDESDLPFNRLSELVEFTNSVLKKEILDIWHERNNLNTNIPEKEKTKYYKFIEEICSKSEKEINKYLEKINEVFEATLTEEDKEYFSTHKHVVTLGGRRRRTTKRGFKRGRNKRSRNIIKKLFRQTKIKTKV